MVSEETISTMVRTRGMVVLEVTIMVTITTTPTIRDIPRTIAETLITVIITTRDTTIVIMLITMPKILLFINEETCPSAIVPITTKTRLLWKTNPQTHGHDIANIPTFA